MGKVLYKAPKGSFFDGEQPPNGPEGQPMRRVFIEWLARPNGTEVEVLPQAWKCPVTGAEVMDDWQKHCLYRAVELAAASDGRVLFYHTRARRADRIKL